MTQRSGSLHGFKQDPYREGKKFDDSHLKDRGWDDTVYDYQLADGLIIYQQCRYDKVRLPPSDKSHWFHLANVEIDNNSPLFGEEI